MRSFGRPNFPHNRRGGGGLRFHWKLSLGTNLLLTSLTNCYVINQSIPGLKMNIFQRGHTHFSCFFSALFRLFLGRKFPFFHFQFSPFPFFDFLLFLSVFPFYPCLSFPSRSAEISQWEVSGGGDTLPPMPPAVTPLINTNLASAVDWWCPVRLGGKLLHRSVHLIYSFILYSLDFVGTNFPRG